APPGPRPEPAGLGRRHDFALSDQPVVATVTPQGLLPAFTRWISLPAARSTTETSLDGPLAANRYLPSGDRMMPQGRAPTLMLPVTAKLVVSTIATVPPRPVLA